MKRTGLAAALIAAGVVSTGMARPEAPPGLVEYADYSIVHTMPGRHGVEIQKLVRMVELRFRELERATGPHVRVAMLKMREAMTDLERALESDEIESKIRIDVGRLLTAIREAMPGDSSVRAGDGSVRAGDGSVRPEDLAALRSAVRNLVTSYGR